MLEAVGRRRYSRLRPTTRDGHPPAGSAADAAPDLRPALRASEAGVPRVCDRARVTESTGARTSRSGAGTAASRDRGDHSRGRIFRAAAVPAIEQRETLESCAGEPGISAPPSLTGPWGSLAPAPFIEEGARTVGYRTLPRGPISADVGQSRANPDEPKLDRDYARYSAPKPRAGRPLLLAPLC